MPCPQNNILVVGSSKYGRKIRVVVNMVLLNFLIKINASFFFSYENYPNWPIIIVSFNAWFNTKSQGRKIIQLLIKEFNLFIPV